MSRSDQHESHSKIVPSPNRLKIYHSGPSLTQKKLPALFYFALSGQESLNQEPYNQPVAALANENIHVFSFTLPAHGPGFKNTDAMQHWARSIEHNKDLISEFVADSKENIDYLVTEGYVDPEKIAVAGLSRGGFVATHLAAADERINTILAFAPLTQLDILTEFEHLQNHPLVQSLSLLNLLDKLVHKRLRYYIGNRDIRVETEECFQFVKTLADTAYDKGVRSPHVELMISPSIGHKGHGTSPHIFQDGANWIKKVI